MFKWIKKKFIELDKYVTWVACRDGCHPKRVNEDMIEEIKEQTKERFKRHKHDYYCSYYLKYNEYYDRLYCENLLRYAEEICAKRHCCQKDMFGRF